MEKNEQSRRRFLKIGAGAAGALTLFSGIGLLFGKRKTQGKAGTIKMLSQDGKLVEVDSKLLSNPTRKATNKDLQEWIKR